MTRVWPLDCLAGPARRGLAAVLLSCFALALAAPAKAQDHGPRSVADLAEGLLESVVNISTAQNLAANRSQPRPEVPDGSPFEEFFEDFFDRDGDSPDVPRPRRVQSLGSGFIISEDGIVVTNNHVIEGADEVIVNLNDDTRLVAEVLGRDPKTDIAVLKVEADRPLPALDFRSSESIRVGDWVMAIGNPFGLGGTVTVGIVSARDRDINSGPYDDYIQTDAAINRGNSGGPLFSMDGRVIGINTAIISPTGGSIGIGFAIPSDIAVRVIDQLRTYGETRRGWLGVRIQTVTDDIAESLGMDQPRGALVAGVTEGGPAEAAGIKSGDVIVSFDGREVPDMRELPRMVADSPIGENVDVEILRDGEAMTLAVDLGRLEEAERQAAEGEDGAATSDADPAATQELLGMTLANLSAALRESYDISGDVEGVLVTAVEPDSPAGEKRVQEGDVIVEVAQEPISTVADVLARVEALKGDDRKTALFLLANANGDLRFVAVRLDG